MLRNKLTHNIMAYLCGISILVIFLVISIFMPTFSMGFYSAEYDKYSIPQKISVPKEQLMDVTRHLTDYMQGNQPDLVVYADVAGVNREFFNDKEKAHMVDVKLLFDFADAAWKFAICIALVCGVVLTHTGNVRCLARACLITQLIFISILIILTGIIALDFDSAFTTFHHIFFNNDLWQLDPQTDLLVNIVPLEFFIDISIRVAVIFGGLMMAFMLGLTAFLRKASKGR